MASVDVSALPATASAGEDDEEAGRAVAVGEEVELEPDVEDAAVPTPHHTI